jgi:desulfoferrodoxin (superoxide reductase-like protein)
LKVFVGKDEEHPMEEDHFIACIALFDENDEKIEEQFFSP